MFLNKTNESCFFIHADLKKNTKKLHNLWIMTIENETLFGLLDGSPMHIDLEASLTFGFNLKCCPGSLLNDG